MLSLYCGNKISLWSLLIFIHQLILVNLKEDYSLVWRPILTSSRFLADKPIVNQGWHKSWARIRKAHNQDCKFSKLFNISLTYWPTIRCQEKIELMNVQVEPVSFCHPALVKIIHKPIVAEKYPSKMAAVKFFLDLVAWCIHSCL